MEIFMRLKSSMAVLQKKLLGSLESFNVATSFFLF